ncbi:MAG: GGDEF domain-containing protein [Lachnospiraceae bacterium]|nr:GGDEF domain-containing protein [Lachnospiraceae bacterium]
MEKTKYNQEIQALIDSCLTEISILSPRVKGTLRQIIQRGKDLQDDALLGFAYYYQAQCLYYQGGSSASYRSCLKKAFFHALRADDQAMLSHIYGFIAADALNNGCFDIAYNNYIMALSIANRRGDAKTRSLVEANIGRLYGELRDYKAARKYVRKSIAQHRKQKNAFRYLQNMVIMLASDALISLNLKDLPAAEKSIREMESFFERGSGEVQAELQLSRLYLLTRLALEKGEEEESTRLFEEFLPVLRQQPQVQDMLEDIVGLYHILMEKDRSREALELLTAVEAGIMGTDVAYVMCAFCELKADYYRAMNQPRKLNEILHTYMELSARLRREQREMYTHAVTLSNLIEGLREERRRVMEENEALIRQASTDALTGIPNRFQLNHVLDEAFGKIGAKRQSVGLAILDIDHFKEYNDNYGHQSGDECLIRIARTLSDIAEKYNIFCARYGGDEFVMVYTDFDDAAILRVVEEIRTGITALGIRHEYQSHQDTVTVSQGICNDIPTRPSSPWDFLSVADEALYSIKKERGKNSRRGFYALAHYIEPEL